jgi:hypothetical protein
MQNTPEDVAEAFNNFLTVYRSFCENNGLSGNIDNVFEILTAMTDKHGRICRQVKHYERNDPKNDWPDALGESLTGFIVYSTMLLKRYNIDITKSMIEELLASISQHANQDD